MDNSILVPTPSTRRVRGPAATSRDVLVGGTREVFPRSPATTLTTVVAFLSSM
ncbi:MAG: hypothetical protein IPH09_15595 [bacterium]|nr:hypothetical protein [bacterium]